VHTMEPQHDGPLQLTSLLNSRELSEAGGPIGPHDRLTDLAATSASFSNLIWTEGMWSEWNRHLRLEGGQPADQMTD
jgi:hypothetical protein